MLQRLLYAAVIFSLFSLSCTEKTIIDSSAASLVDPAIAPRVLYAYPPLNSVGPYVDWDPNDAPYSLLVELRFNKLMDPASVRGAIAASSSQRLVHIDSGSVASSSRETYRFRISGASGEYINYRLGESITLSFSRPVADVNGKLIPAGDLGSFEPEPAFRLRLMSPKDGSLLYPSGTGYLTLVFNSKIDASVLPFVSVMPPLPGPWKEGPDSISLSVPLTITSPEQAFDVSVAAGAPDKFGNRTPVAFHGSLHAAPFTGNLGYYLDTMNVPMYQSYHVSFSYRLDTASIRSAIHITPAVEGGLYVPLAFGTSQVPIAPAIEFAPSTYYAVVIDTTLRALGGFHPSEPFSFSFYTGPFQVLSSYPPDQSTEVSTSSSISYYLSAGLDTGTVRRSFSIVPARPGPFVLYGGSDYFYFYPTNGFLPNTMYTVTLDVSLKTVGGHALTAPYTFSFTTGN